MDIHNIWLFSSVWGLMQRTRNKQRNKKKTYDKEAYNSKLFAAVVIKEWQLWPHVLVPDNESIIHVQPYIFYWLVSIKKWI